MHLPPPVSPEQLARLQTLADNTNARARNLYHLEYGIGALADQIHRDADHRGDLYTNVTRGSVTGYRLDEFIADTEREASRAASAAIGPGATVMFIAPQWVATALERPLPPYRYLTVPFGRHGQLPGVWHLLAVAAASPRAPRPLCFDWDWCAVYPCVTPDRGADIETIEVRPCAGVCDDDTDVVA